jgi:hypothetical protein
MESTLVKNQEQTSEDTSGWPLDSEKIRNLAVPKPGEPIKRNARYLAWVRTQPCILRGTDCIGRTEAHHTARAYGGLKGCDHSAVPLCSFHHRLVQDYPWRIKQRYGYVPDEITAETYYDIWATHSR